MITHEQYEHYKKLVEEYEQAEYEASAREFEEDEDLDDDLDECDYCGRDQFSCRCEQIMNCHCGAYTKTGAHVADCICGAD
jgi:hypothetical protein